MDQGEKQQSSNEVLEKNKRDALRLAKEIYGVVCQPEFVQLDHEVRMKTVQEKVPDFCKAYPSIIRWMVRDLKYNEKAFIDYLNMLEREHHSDKKVEPGKGYLEYIRKQAEYSRMLYKRSVPHWDPKIANNIYRKEYDAMVKTYDEMKEEEEEYTNEFEEEKIKHKQQKIQEILNFIEAVKPKAEKGNSIDNSVSTNSDDVIDISTETYNKLKNVTEIIDYRMKQAEILAKTGGVPDTEEAVEIQESSEVPISEDEYKKRQTRFEAEQKLEKEKAEAEAAELLLKQQNRASSFLTEPQKPKRKHKNKSKNRNRK